MAAGHFRIYALLFTIDHASLMRIIRLFSGVIFSAHSLLAVEISDKLPLGYYQGPCGSLSSDAELQERFKLNKNMKVGRGKLVAEAWRIQVIAEAADYYLVNDLSKPDDSFVRLLFHKGVTHSVLHYGYHTINLESTEYQGFSWNLENAEYEWSWKVADTLRSEVVTGNKVKVDISQQIFLGGQWRYKPVSSKLIAKEESWSFNHKLIPRSFRDEYICGTEINETIQRKLLKFNKADTKPKKMRF